MLRSVFLKALRDHGRSLLWWLVGVAAYTIFIMLFYPTLQQNSQLLGDYLKALPEPVLAAFMGMGEARDITSPAGFLNAYLFALVMPVIILVYAVIAGGDAIAGEEERGTLDLLLANPIGRVRVLLEKFAFLAVGVTVLAAATWLSVEVGALPVHLTLPHLGVAAVCISLILFGMAFGGLALATGAATGSRGTAGAVAAAVAVFSYLMYSFAPSVPPLEPYRVASLMYLYNGADPLNHGLNPVHAAVLVVFTLACLAVGVLFFRRRDLAA